MEEEPTPANSSKSRSVPSFTPSGTTEVSVMERGLFQLLLLSGLLSLTPAVERRFHLVQQKMAWLDAQAYCRAKYVDLATIDGDADMTELQNEAQFSNFSSTAWIGLYNDVNSWRWSYGNVSVNITNWNMTQPNNRNGIEECGVITSRGYWADVSCTEERPFLCFNAKTKFIYVSNNLTWHNAQNYCRQYHIDLANTSSVLNTLELILMYSGNTQPWIGLFRDSWKWSDLTRPSTISWMPGKPDNAAGGENCGAIDKGLIDDANCSSQFEFFCYSTITGKEQIMRLEMQSGQEANDPVFRAVLLEKIKQKLVEQGMAGNTIVKWRGQPDGMEETGILPAVSLSVQRHYHLIQTAKNWTDAQAFCRLSFVDLATIESLTDMINLGMEALKHRFLDKAWVGLYNDIDSWRWSLNDTPLGDLKKWGPREPNNGKGHEECAKMDNSGLWYDADCAQKITFVCYDANSTAFIFFLDPKSTWKESQAYCRQHHTDLASPEDETENVLAQTVITGGTAWMGLSRDSWKWSDKTHVSTVLWQLKQPDNAGGKDNCAYVFGGFLNDDNCAVQRPFFCYSYPKQRKVIQVEVQYNQDVNDPAVRAAIMEKMKQKLKEQGLSETTTLKWREQPNGMVFHKKKVEETTDTMENTTVESSRAQCANLSDRGHNVTRLMKTSALKHV
ncbi:hypothetical protein NFI96_000095 [Prochilodus magdalenae]|nr:hypothetical protein NFI96_000095 [Prochilodus magdalenae]